MVVGSMTVNTDIVVIGGGPGGYVAAIRAAQLGKDVIIVDDQPNLGGVCLNTGCIPTKAIITASNFYNKIKEMTSMGVVITDYHFDVEKMFSWKDGVVKKLSKGIATLCEKYGIEVIQGRGFFEGPNLLHIEGKSDVTAINFKNAIISTGSVTIQIPGFPFDGNYVIGSTEALSMAQVPRKLVIVGGGYIGTEMGTVYGKLGCEVHILEGSDRLVSVIDSELVTVVERNLKLFNVTPHYNCKAKSMQIIESAKQVEVIYDENGKEQKITADKILVVVGRKPNSRGLNLEKTQVKVDERGFIVVDAQMKTTQPNIFAVGDVVGQPMLAHKAQRQGKVAAEVICGLPSAFDNKVIPFVVFNDPEIMSVGMTLADAQKRGYDAREERFPHSALGRAMIHDECGGFTKIVCDNKTKLVLGIHAVGPSVSEFAGEAALAIEMGATVDDLSLTIHPHPTMSESIVEAADAVLGSAVHIFKTPKK